MTDAKCPGSRSGTQSLTRRRRVDRRMLDRVPIEGQPSLPISREPRRRSRRDPDCLDCTNVASCRGRCKCCEQATALSGATRETSACEIARRAEWIRSARPHSPRTTRTEGAGSQHQNPYRNFPEASRFSCFTVSMESRGDEMADRRLTSWDEWYRFARRELGYAHGEAVAYANVRTVEDLNRARRLHREAA